MDPIIGDGTSEVPEQYDDCAMEASNIMTTFVPSIFSQHFLTEKFKTIWAFHL